MYSLPKEMMFNNEQQASSLFSSSMDPRISFSNDFADPLSLKYQTNYREAPVSSDFEFSVKNYAMIPADEIFFKGMLLPLKDDNDQQGRKLTLRDTLLVDDDDDDEFEDSFPRLQKSSGWWKERLGLKRSNTNLVPKIDRNIDGIREKVVDGKINPMFAYDEDLVSSNKP